jgi:hypothetical protein
MQTLLLLLLLPGAGTGGHLAHNPVYRGLLEKGVRVAGSDHVRLPPPTLADGMDGPAQRAAIEAIPGRHVTLDQLFRKSVVAPLVFHFREIEAPGRKVPVHGVDVWFVVYAPLDMLTRKDFVDEVFHAGQRDARQKGVTFTFLRAADLRARKIAPPSESDDRERYVYSAFSLLDRVQLGLTSHTHVDRTDESLVFAAEVDPRFASDKEYGNRWRPMERPGGGKPELGPASPYEGAASYVKITRLAEPAGALLVEQHMVFVEPKEWFRGTPLLRSKLPMLVQTEVRRFRRLVARRQ